MEAAAGQTLDDAGVGLAHAVYRETDGNPFFVSELLRHLSETGAIHQDATGRWVAEDSLDADGPARQRPRGDRGAGRASGSRRRTRAVDGRGHRSGLRPRRPGSGDGDLRGRAARHPRRRHRRRPGARAGQRSRSLQLRPRPHPAHPLRGPGPHPSGPGAPAGGRSAGGRSAATVPGPGSANWPVTGSAQPSPST